MRKLLYKSFLAANILVVIALILSYLAVHVNPATFALPALFGLAYPYLLFINIVFAFFWAVLIRWEALISILVIAAGFTHFSNFIRLSKSSGDKTDTFAVQSYNVRLFNYFEGKKNSISEKRIIDLLKNNQPEIICLQEIYITGDPGKKEKEIRTALGGRYYTHFKMIPSGKNRYYGIATLSKYPIIAKGDIIHENSSSLSIYSDFVRGKDTIRIFNNHLQSFHLHRMERTFLDEMTETSDDKETIDEIKNLAARLRNGFVKRASQSERLKSKINRSPYPVIVAGDFNDTPVSYSYRKIRKGLNDAFVSSGFGAGFTYRGNYPPNRIDYILYSDDFVCHQFDVKKIRYSDHYPIAAYFRMK